MVLKVKGSELLGTCNACGGISKLNNVHKLTAFVIKNPPKNLSDFDHKKDDAHLHPKDNIHSNNVIYFGIN